MKKEHKYKGKDEYKDNDKDKDAERITESLTVTPVTPVSHATPIARPVEDGVLPTHVMSGRLERVATCNLELRSMPWRGHGPSQTRRNAPCSHERHRTDGQPKLLLRYRYHAITFSARVQRSSGAPQGARGWAGERSARERAPSSRPPQPPTCGTQALALTWRKVQESIQ